MPPKRRAASSSKAGRKKVKVEEEAPKDAFQSAKEALKSAAPEQKSQRRVDGCCHISAEVHEDYDCMLNQTNIGNNNNKFYVIQVLTSGKSYHCWTRWGRVGEQGAFNLSSPFSDVNKAIKEFEKKFKDKTKNNWSDRQNFVTHPGKYTLIEVDGDEDAEIKVDTVDAPQSKVSKNVLPCTLDVPTKKLIELIFSQQMFKEAMEAMNLDIKKMPLGKLSKSQIAKGFEVIEQIEEAVKSGSNQKCLEELSSNFFTIIPHNFGRCRPPVICDAEVIEKKKEMLLVLADIEVAQSLQAESGKPQEVEMVPHPLDKDYQSLKCNLNTLGSDTEEFQVIQKYLDATAAGYRKAKIVDVWQVEREAEAERFKQHDHLENRRLLWHGTNVAVVAAILKGGLRIMPHSGGRVGKGIYFASENCKSASYVSTSKGFGIMFLNEVALGREHTITNDDCSLRKPPAGFDSVVARGSQEPDPSKDVFITLDGKKVAVPHGRAKKQPQYKDSSFSNSEYLIYKESQCCIRYMLKLSM
ncbi:hypothetical protein AALO_G00143160 [Alosa alosa]|uniref:Poly [ADP-ribose] polymerase n=1 Tax=Alosa alosa TaxID=278164 RepID=A0AAV6GKR1_9TELE|nr:protein mono-ADP-ribosyltransferase PARP3 [Alosa alosa]KAG5275064.1 hypothetical protein AALO_G00143160 [Alosa alosa]